MIASEKCYQLARYLYCKRTEIPYEDIKIASTQLLQCASNVLTVRKKKKTLVNKEYKIKGC